MADKRPCEKSGLAVRVITLFPEMFVAVSDYGITGKATRSGLLQLSTVNPRDYTTDRHRAADDRPYGGGPGMVMMAEPLRAAIQSARAELPGAAVVYLSPQGKKLQQRDVMAFAGRGSLILIAGRYEGIDERVIELEVDEEWSIGDYVLSGGELPAMVLIDAIARCLPGVLGNEESAPGDSFLSGNIGLSALHPTGEGGGSVCPGDIIKRRSCRHPEMAPETGLGTYLETPAGPAGGIASEY